MEEIMNRTRIIARLMPEIMVPIIVSQFLEDGGSFMPVRFKRSIGVKIEKYYFKQQVTDNYY
jgi:hypothetical protein